MSSLPEISGVMSAYNGLDGFRETMDSVLSQEDVSLEFIIIDDGSTDGTNVTLLITRVMIPAFGSYIRSTRALPVP